MLVKNLLSSISIVALMTATVYSSSLRADLEEYEQDQKTAGICHLSPEVRLEILSHLSPKDLARVSSVSRPWHDVAEDGALWNRFLQGLQLGKFDGVPSKTLVRTLTDPTVVGRIIEIVSASLPPYLNDALAELGYEAALKRKVNGLCYGWNGYTKDLVAARNLIDELSTQNIEWAKIIKYNALEGGDDVYTKNLEEAERLFKDSIAKGEGWALGFIDALGISIYKLKSNEYWVAQGKDWALKNKFEGLCEGKNGYQKNIPAAHNLIDELVAEKKVWAIEEKFTGLLKGCLGYVQNVKAAHEFLEDLAIKDIPWAVEKKFIGLLFGNNGYTKNLEEAERLLKDSGEKGQTWPFLYYMDGKLLGWEGFKEEQNDQWTLALISYIDVQWRLHWNNFKIDDQLPHRYVDFLKAVKGRKSD